MADKIAAIGELEHLRRHAKRSAVVAKENNEDFIHYQIIAQRAETTRRKLMKEWFGLNDLDHCLGKTAATLRQLIYEIDDGDTDNLVEVDELVDLVWSHALGIDMSGCKSCQEDSDGIE